MKLHPFFALLALLVLAACQPDAPSSGAADREPDQYDGDDILLLTSLASDQAIRTANIVGAMCVVVHNAKPLPQTMCQVADTLGIPLVSSPLSKYESCVRIHDFLAKEAGEG